MRKWIMLALIPSSPSLAIDDDAQMLIIKKAFSVHFECVQERAHKYASTKESASDIAEVAVAQCIEPQAFLKRELGESINGVMFTSVEVQAQLNEAINGARRAAMSNIFKTRYPKH